MRLAALDSEFGFTGRPFDWLTVVVVCGVLRLAGGVTITACPKLGAPWSVLTPYLEDNEILIAMHHGMFAERRVLKHLNLPFPESHCWDTELAERVIHITTRGTAPPINQSRNKAHTHCWLAYNAGEL